MSVATLALIGEALAPVLDRQLLPELQWVADSDNLEIVVDNGDGVPYAQAWDLSAPACWDGCNGITRRHRPGWCHVNPAHADLDCCCGMDWSDDYQDEEAS